MRHVYVKKYPALKWCIAKLIINTVPLHIQRLILIDQMMPWSPTDVFPNVKSSCGWGWGDAVSVGLIYWLLWDNVPRKASMGSSLVHSQEPANGNHFSKIPHLVMSDKIHTNLGCQFCLIVTLNWLLVGKLWIIEL